MIRETIRDYFSPLRYLRWLLYPFWLLVRWNERRQMKRPDPPVTGTP